MAADGGPRLLVDVDEGKANLLLFELPGDDGELEAFLGRRRVRPPIVTDRPDDPLRALLTAPITRVEEISREPDPTWHGARELCGLRLTLAGQTRVLVGTHLSSLDVPGVWFLLPGEADPALRYAPLAVPGVRITYAAGNEHSPTDPFGRTELVIHPDGTARLDHHQIGRHRAWTGVVDTAVLRRLLAGLERAGHPEYDPRPIPPDTTMRSLVTQRAGALESASIPWHAAAELPGYAEAFEILDSLVLQMSGESVRAAPATLPPAVTRLRQIDS